MSAARADAAPAVFIGSRDARLSGVLASLAGRVALIALLAAGCGKDHVVIELNGAIPNIAHVDVILLEPVVLARMQRRNVRMGVPPHEPEAVYYVAQRNKTGFDVDGPTEGVIEGLQFEIQDAGGPYVPLVVASSASGVVAAMGIYNPASVFAAKPQDGEHYPDAVQALADVTLYPITLEPITSVIETDNTGPVEVSPSQVMSVRCADKRSSGAVWRRADQKQLRVLLPLEDSKVDAVERLSGMDLDCDEHSPGLVPLARREAGDELDCDDTSFSIHGKARERCSAVDEDCNPETTLSPAPCTNSACGAMVGVCDDSPAQQPTTVCPSSCRVCDVPWDSSGGSGMFPCESDADLLLGPLCGAGNACRVTLVDVSPGWHVEIGPGHGINEPVDIVGDVPLRVAVKSGTSFPTPDVPVGGFLLHVSKGPGAVVVESFTLTLPETSLGCAVAGTSRMTCN